MIVDGKEARGQVYFKAGMLALGPASTLGFARFSYSLLLPAMEKTLNWNYQKLGMLNTVNALGYLVGAICATPISNRFGARKTFTIALLSVAVMGALSGSTSSFGPILIARTLSGISAGVGFVTGGSLISSASSKIGPRVTAVALGIYYAGAGIGIVISGLALPPLLSHFGMQAWHEGWFLMAGFSLLSAIVSGSQARSLNEPPKHSQETKASHQLNRLRASIIAYALFGAGYISFITFLVAFLKSQGSSSAVITLFWTVLGLSVIVSGPLWGRTLTRLTGGKGLTAVLMVAALGILIPLFSRSLFILLLSAFLFGIALMSTSTAVTLIAQRNLDSRSIGSAIGRFTMAIAIGQTFGPVVVGTLSDTSQGLKLGILASLAMIVASIAVSLFQKDVTSFST